MAYEDCLAHVLDDVLARDLPDELLGQALADEAELHSRGSNEKIAHGYSSLPTAAAPPFPPFPLSPLFPP